jgi:hypothetical protein
VNGADTDSHGKVRKGAIVTGRALISRHGTIVGIRYRHLKYERRFGKYRVRKTKSTSRSPSTIFILMLDIVSMRRLTNEFQSLDVGVSQLSCDPSR